MAEVNQDRSSNNTEEHEDGDRNTELEKQKGRKQHEEEEEDEEEEKVLQFLDSLDNYLVLMDSLSSTLRQGWLDLASARYAMGATRVTSALFDLKLHPAASTLRVTQRDLPQDSMVKEPHFALSRWSSSCDEPCSSGDLKYDEAELQKKSDNSLLRSRGTSANSADKEHKSKASPVSPRSPLAGDDQVHKERSKSLSIFGTLVSPKLREAQVSFETALETLVEIANMQSMMRSAHTQIQQKKDGCTE